MSASLGRAWNGGAALAVDADPNVTAPLPQRVERWRASKTNLPDTVWMVADAACDVQPWMWEPMASRWFKAGSSASLAAGELMPLGIGIPVDVDFTIQVTANGGGATAIYWGAVFT